MFSNELSLVPHLPGSYQMYNKEGIIIYVGKAKNLKNRLSSYFTGRVYGKTAKMVSEVDHFKYIVTNTETEAFILEINLIKKYDPKYNILLRDDKSYPYIELVKKPYPTLKIVRYLKIKRDDNRKLYGPYPNASAARRVVKLINRLYPLKKCDGHPKKVCLYYHIGECLGYCVNNVDQEKLNNMEQEIIDILKGNNELIKNRILKAIEINSESLNFEVAKELKEELDYINIVAKKQEVELNDLVNRDVINYFQDKEYISIQIFFIRNGKLLGSHNDIYSNYDFESSSLEEYIILFYKNHELPKEILVNENINYNELSKVLESNVITVTKGLKKKLLNLVGDNAKINLNNKVELLKKDFNRTIMANEELKNILKLDKLYSIEIFDNSNLFGTYSVSGMVVYKDGVPSKKDYRKFKISTEKNDDYHTMKEVIYRRYYRLLIEKKEMPDLIIVDGGENQINATKDVLNDLNLHIPLCGLKKDDHHRTNKLIDNNLNVIDIDMHSNLFAYLTRMQDEVHRFTINYHKEIRSVGSIASVLNNINGIGDIRKKELIKKYGSLKRIKEVPIDELKTMLPLKVAEELFDFMHHEE